MNLTRVADLGDLGLEGACREGVAEAELRFGSGRRSGSKARKSFCQLGVTQSGVTTAAAARFLGVTTSAVSRSVAGGVCQQ